MIKDLCCVGVLQTNAAIRQQNEIHTQTHTTNADNHTSHADNEETNKRYFSPYFFFDFSLRNQSINQSSQVCTRSNAHKDFF
jgi:hypothetical protein